MRTQLVIFDCDGVLVDSEEIAARVIVEMIAELGGRMELDDAVREFRGRRMPECLRMIETRLGTAVPVDFEQRLRVRMGASFSLQLRAVEGIREALDRIAIPICVASSGPRSKIEHSLQLTGLIERFAGRIFSSYEIGSWKPAPDLFLYASVALGAPPDACVVVEDSLPGVQAGIAAGMRVLGYAPSGERASELEAAGALPFSSMHRLPTLLADG